MDEANLSLELYLFSYYDELRKRWIRARYRATLQDIAAHYSRYRIEGAPEIRAEGQNGFTPPGGRDT